MCIIVFPLRLLCVVGKIYQDIVKAILKPLNVLPLSAHVK